MLFAGGFINSKASVNSFLLPAALLREMCELSANTVLVINKQILIIGGGEDLFYNEILSLFLSLTSWPIFHLG